MRHPRPDEEQRNLALVPLEDQPSKTVPVRRRYGSRLGVAVGVVLVLWAGVALVASHRHSTHVVLPEALPIGGYPFFSSPGWHLVDQRTVTGHQLSVYRYHEVGPRQGEAAWCWDLVSTGSYGTLTCQRGINPLPRLTISFSPPDPGLPDTIVLRPRAGAPDGWASSVSAAKAR